MANNLINKAVLDTSNFSNGIKSMQNEMRVIGKECGALGSSFSTVTGLVSKFAAAAGVAMTAMDVATDAIKSNEVAYDSWMRSIDGAKGAYNQFITSLANGTWDNFFAQINDAIDRAKTLYNEFDRLGSISVNNSPVIGRLREQIENLRLNGGDPAEIAALTRQMLALQNDETKQGKSANFQAIVNNLMQYSNGGKLFSEGQAIQAALNIIEKGQSYYDDMADIYGSMYKKTGVGEKYLGGLEDPAKAIAAAVTKAEGNNAEFIKAYAQYEQAQAANQRAAARIISGTQKGSSTSPKTPKTSTKTDTTKPLDLFYLNNEQYMDIEPADVDLIERFTKQQKELAKVNLAAELSAGNSEFAAYIELLKNIQSEIDDAIEKEKEMRENTQAMANAIGQVGSSFSALGDAFELPALNIAGTLAQAIASIILSYSQAMQSAALLGPWAWLGFGATGLGELAAIISSVKSLGSYAGGGTVKAPFSHGDLNTINVNGGEMVLNQGQQANLFKALDKGVDNTQTGAPSYIRLVADGRDLIAVMDKNLKQISRNR